MEGSQAFGLSEHGVSFLQGSAGAEQSGPRGFADEWMMGCERTAWVLW